MFFVLQIIYNNSVKEKESLMEQVPAVLENEKTAETVETEPNYSVYETASSSSSEESDPGKGCDYFCKSEFFCAARAIHRGYVPLTA